MQRHALYYVHRALTAAQNCAHGDDQDLIKVVQRGVPRARIIQPVPENIGDCAKIPAAQIRTTTIGVRELFIRNTDPNNLPLKNGVYVYKRWVPFFCDQVIGSSFRFGEAFSPLGGLDFMAIDPKSLAPGLDLPVSLRHGAGDYGPVAWQFGSGLVAQKTT